MDGQNTEQAAGELKAMITNLLWTRRAGVNYLLGCA
jgi:hypothetical protein